MCLVLSPEGILQSFWKKACNLKFICVIFISRKLMICVWYIIIFLFSYLLHFACHKFPVVYLLKLFITSNLSSLVLLHMYQPPLFQKPWNLRKYAVFPQFVLSFEIIPSVSDLKSRYVCLKGCLIILSTGLKRYLHYFQISSAGPPTFIALKQHLSSSWYLVLISRKMFPSLVYFWGGSLKPFQSLSKSKVLEMTLRISDSLQIAGFHPTEERHGKHLLDPKDK